MKVDPTESNEVGIAHPNDAISIALLKAKSSLVTRLRGGRQRHLRSTVLDGEVSQDAKSGASSVPRSARQLKMSWSISTFVLFVLLPFLASIIYFAWMASDQYIAEARFAVRSLAENRPQDGVDADILSMSTMSQDGYIVTSFIHSTEILRRIGKSIDYRHMFSRSDADLLARFDADKSNEEFLDYWKQQVTTYVDGPSGIVTLKTRTFSPEESKELAAAIIRESEQLINELSVRAQRDTTERFSAEVKRTNEGYRLALEALNQFQNTTGFLTPETRATETGSLLAGLLAQKLEIDTRLFVLKESNAVSSPSHQQLALASKSIEDRIVKLREDLAGASRADENIANTIRTFARLETDRRVAEALYESAQKNFETAQAEATRKALYIVVFVPPTLPQEALYPHRWSTPFLILVALSVAWVTLALIWASVEDHRL